MAIKILYRGINLLLALGTLNKNLYLNHFYKKHSNKKPRHLKRLYWLEKSIPKQQITSYVQGKSVAIVGNAKSLLESDYGHYIDRSDIVIRINRANILNAQAQGTKTHIWATSFSYPFGHHQQGYQFCIWLTPMFHSNLCYPHNKIFSDKLIYLYDFKDFCHLEKRLGAYPTSGMMLIDFITKYTHFKKLDLYGFDFFKTPNMYENVDFKNNHKFHDFEKEEQFIHALLHKDKRIKLKTVNSNKNIKT